MVIGLIMDSVLHIHKNNKLIISFGGTAVNNIQKFESVNTLEKIFPEYSKIFFIDRKCSWYHKGICSKSDSIKSTVEYIKQLIEPYSEVSMIGVSMGGYAAILFGSLLNVKNVIAFIPQTRLDKSPIFNNKYLNLRRVINKTTKYSIYGAKNMGGNHCVSQYNNMKGFSNVDLTIVDICNIKMMRDNGDYSKVLKEKIDQDENNNAPLPP